MQGVQSRRWSRQDGRQERRDSSPFLLTADDITAQLGIDRSTVYRMAADGRLSAIKVGRQWRFPTSAIEGLLSAMPSSPPSAPLQWLGDDRARQLLTITAEQLGVMMVVTDMDGAPLIRPVNPCAWFELHAPDQHMIEMCTSEWRTLADTPCLAPSFRRGALGFECAGAFIRDGHLLMGQVLAGGVAPAGCVTEGLYHLTETERTHVLNTLPRIAAALSRTTTRSNPTIEESL